MLDKINFRFLLFVFAVTIFTGFAFTLSNYIHVPVDGMKDWILTIGHFQIVMLGCFTLYYFMAINKYLFAVVFPIEVLATSIIAYFAYFQNVSLTTSILDAALHNDLRTSLDLVTLPVLLFCASSLAISIVAVIFRFKFMSYKFKLIELIAVCIIGLSVFEVNQLRYKTVSHRLPFSIYYVSKKYVGELQNDSKPRVAVDTDAYCTTDTITVVLVIGEAARADHFQLNGYKRATNPLLSKLPVVSYPHIYSEWTHTNLSLAHFLTRSDSVNHEPSITECSFISIFNHCGFATTWIANQEPAPSYTPFVKEAKKVDYVNPSFSVYNYNKKWLDADDLPHLDQALNEAAPRKLIIIHTIGSHWWYNDHFTDSTTVFKPILETKNIVSASNDEIVNSYDNTIVYTDYFLSRVINRLSSLNACMIYLSDHGESLGENGKWLHAQDNEPEKHPACVLWFSKKYINQQPKKYAYIVANKNRRWRTDFVFHSILSIGDINSNSMAKGVDITSIN
ncbi:MAG TPA: phosphoethanolamine transferase [Williamwhitmania sp.]|nr:phosphoethanolamine transferase [Williamwhitmania sp.]